MHGPETRGIAVEYGGNVLLCFSKAVSSGSPMLLVENVEQDEGLEFNRN